MGWLTWQVSFYICDLYWVKFFLLLGWSTTSETATSLMRNKRGYWEFLTCTTIIFRIRKMEDKSCSGHNGDSCVYLCLPFVLNNYWRPNLVRLNIFDFIFYFSPWVFIWHCYMSMLVWSFWCWISGLNHLKRLELSDTEVGSSGLHHLSGQTFSFLLLIRECKQTNRILIKALNMYMHEMHISLTRYKCIGTNVVFVSNLNFSQFMCLSCISP